MPFRIDADIVIFLCTAIAIVFGAMPLLRKGATPIPIDVAFEEIPLLSLTPAQQKALAEYDGKLARLGFNPTCTYRWANLGHNLIRSYLSPGYMARCVLMIVELKTNTDGVEQVSHQAVFEFDTRFSDGTVLVTSNPKLKSVMTHPSSVISQEIASSNPAAIKRLHDAGMAKIKASPLPPPSEARDIFREVATEHRRVCEYRVNAGEFKLSADGKHYLPTDKVLWRGIRNYFSPFGTRFSPARLMVAFAAALAAPVFEVPYVSQWLTTTQIVSHSQASLITTVVCGLITGAVIGLALEHNTFLWSFLLTYASMRVFHMSPGAVGFSAAIAAHTVTRWNNRRKILLLPEAQSQPAEATASGSP